MTDVMKRAKCVLSDDMSNPFTLMQRKAELVPELVSELEENVGVMRALRRQRDTAEAKLDAVRALAENPVEVELDAEMVPAVDVLAILDGYPQ